AAAVTPGIAAVCGGGIRGSLQIFPKFECDFEFAFEFEFAEECRLGKGGCGNSSCSCAISPQVAPVCAACGFCFRVSPVGEPLLPSSLFISQSLPNSNPLLDPPQAGP